MAGTIKLIDTLNSFSICSQHKYAIECMRRMSMAEGSMGAKAAVDVEWNSFANKKGSDFLRSRTYTTIVKY